MTENYFILRCRPSKTIDVRDKLRAEFGDAAAVAPSYRTTIRLGRQRKRVDVERAVLGGIVFASADAKASCGCRDRPEHPLRAVPMLSLETDVQGVRHHVTVDATDIQPLIDYADNRNDAFALGTKPAPEQEPPARVAAKPTVPVGACVRLGGVLAGMTGIVVAAALGAVALSLHDGQAGSTPRPADRSGVFASNVTVPVSLIEEIEK